MSTITFTATIENGTIRIPEEYKQELDNGNQVKVTVIKKKKISETDMISHLIENPIQVKDFVPLTRDEIYDRT